MAVEVILPRRGNTVETCLILEWYYRQESCGGCGLNTGGIPHHCSVSSPVSGSSRTKSMQEARAMRNNRTPIITIAGIEDNPDRFVASFRSEFLDATYAVIFSQTITGAVALHRFARMISDQYGKQVELRIANDLLPARSKAVEDILKSIMKPEPIFT